MPDTAAPADMLPPSAALGALGYALAWYLLGWLMTRAATAFLLANMSMASFASSTYVYFLAGSLFGSLVDVSLGLLFFRAAQRRLRRSIW